MAYYCEEIINWIIKNNASSKQVKKHFKITDTGTLYTAILPMQEEKLYNEALEIMHQNSYKDLKSYEIYLFLKAGRANDIRKLYYNFGIKNDAHFNRLILKLKDKKEIYNDFIFLVDELKKTTKEYMEQMKNSKSADFKWRNKDKKFFK
jgi:hypothetical protein